MASDTLNKVEDVATHLPGNIEKQAGKIPADWFLFAALGSIAVSLLLQASDKKQESNFVGHWAPTFLCLGLYNNMLKVLQER